MQLATTIKLFPVSFQIDLFPTAVFAVHLHFVVRRYSVETKPSSSVPSCQQTESLAFEAFALVPHSPAVEAVVDRQAAVSFLHLKDKDNCNHTVQCVYTTACINCMTVTGQTTSGEDNSLQTDVPKPEQKLHIVTSMSLYQIYDLRRTNNRKKEDQILKVGSPINS